MFFSILLSLPVFGQQGAEWQQAHTYLQEAGPELGLQPDDTREFRITDLYTNRKNGISYLYLQQSWQGIPVERGTANAVFDPSGKMVHMQVRFQKQLSSRIQNTQPQLDALQAVKAAGAQLQLSVPANPRVLESDDDATLRTRFEAQDWALEPVEARLRFYPVSEESIRLCWEIHWYQPDAKHRWILFLDAVNGQIVAQQDLVIDCAFGSPDHAHASECLGYDTRGFEMAREARTMNSPNSYRVLPIPVESPNHGSFDIVTDPADDIASPFGWHQTGNQTGTEYTITRGNNVHAYQDAGNNNASIGDEPDGGADLIFDFPFDQSSPPEDYRDAAVTNLFFWCNIMHDVWYQYGFDETAGNFQSNNYSNGGIAGDWIRAEAQDGSGTNNANFSSGGDGSNARIQMYLWTSQPNSFFLTVLDPDDIAGAYQSTSANFGPALPTQPLVGELVQALDDTALPTEVCAAVVNVDDVVGKVALIDRGNCTFIEKVSNAQNAGAIAVIICNNTGGDPITMGGAGGGNITIPSIMIRQDDCNLIKSYLADGVTVSIQGESGGTVFLDGDFDNGIIAHEYGHGLSIRMTGGPSTGGCLGNAEQMGEGWSDYVGLMLTMKPSDVGADIRGIGTFAINQSTTGNGIRPAPYSTDFGVNPFTYGNSNDGNISQPHGVGFIWATAVWEMTWDLVNAYGFDTDFYYGTGGNNIAMHLVTEGMKLQPCNPGMVDGRDAILLADQLFYNGANQCLIWEAFARRGLGASASQGSSFDRFDQLEAFDLPLLCQTPEVAPTALFTPSFELSCTGSFQFSDASFDIPQSWSWDFGDGTTSTLQNPSHTYTESGVYEVMLTVSNTLGESTYSQSVIVEFPSAPVASNVSACKGEALQINASSDGLVNWYLDGELVYTGETLNIDSLEETMMLTLETEIQNPAEQVGPADNNFGAGGYHNTGFTGTIDFTAHTAVIIESVWVDAGAQGNRTVQLLSNGAVVDEVNVFMPEGQSTVVLNLEVPAPGNYSLAGTNVNLYRNNTGASFPYEVENLVTLTGTSAGPEFYYYYYNWIVRERSCFSEPNTIMVEALDLPVAAFNANVNGQFFDFENLSSNASSWFWDFGDGNTSFLQNPSHVYTQGGDYTVTLTVSNGSCNSSSTQAVSVIVSTRELAGLQYFELLPNPGDGLFQVDILSEQPGALNLLVYSTSGQVVHRSVLPGGKQRSEAIDLRTLPAGTYLVTLVSEQGIATKKYVKGK